MSTSATNSPIIPEWRKRSNSISNYSDSPILAKRQKLDYFYVLASESSLSEDERSESVDSIQDRETDYCRDTSDTDTKSEQSSDEYDVKVEYELVTSSDTEENPFASGSSSGEDDALIAAAAAAGAVATIVNDATDMDIWVTDGDDDTDSASSFIEFIRQICKKCKIRETVSCFPLCSHCYQARKNCYPPRPKHKKPRNGTSSRNSESTGRGSGSVTTDRLSACLTVLSQDSGLGSSQEQTSNVNSSQELQTLAWDKVVVPQNLIKSSSTTTTTTTTDSLASTVTLSVNVSDSVDDAADIDDNRKVCVDQTIEDWLSASKEMCIMCHENPKNGIFVHSTGGHLCCCYSCAVKSWTKTKRCAWCNLKAKNVIKAFLV